MASYPTSIKTFTTRLIGDVIEVSHVNDLQDEVTAIETDLYNGDVFTQYITTGLNASALSVGTVPNGRVSGAYTNITTLSLGANVVANVTTLFVGNSTANAVHSATSFALANSTNTATLTPISLTIGTQIANTIGFYAGANVYANTTTVFLGNISSNTVITSGSITINGVAVVTGLDPIVAAIALG